MVVGLWILLLVVCCIWMQVISGNVVRVGIGLKPWLGLEFVYFYFSS